MERRTSTIVSLILVVIILTLAVVSVGVGMYLKLGDKVVVDRKVLESASGNDKEYENGMYEINDNPEKILEHYQTSNKDYIFVRTDENPYMQQFILMAKDKKIE